MNDREWLYQLEREADIYELDGWVHTRRWLEERLNDVSERLLTNQIRTTTFEEVAEQKGQIRELRRMLARPGEVDQEIHRLRANLRAAQETE